LRLDRSQYERDRPRRADELQSRLLFMRDEAGFDEKIAAVPSTRLTKRYQKIENYTYLPEITLRQFEHFFAHYKDLEPGKWVRMERWGDARRHGKLLPNRSNGRPSKRRRDCSPLAGETEDALFPE
jgi:Inorganic pyrophosphatase